MIENTPDHIASPSEACREYARNYGSENPNRAWILSPWDTWECNPFYTGPAVPHPEWGEEEVLPFENTPAYVPPMKEEENLSF